MDRPTIDGGTSTPWGAAQVSRQFADGIVLHWTASHRGFHLDDVANNTIHALYRNDDGFYDEDCEWTKVAYAFPHLFTAYERRLADRTLRDYYPDAYERVMASLSSRASPMPVTPREFEKRHRNDWVVIAALNSDHKPGLVECIAKLGGIRDETGERRFLVPGSDYVIGRYGFVIDPVKHEAYDGPSSFVIWAARR